MKLITQVKLLATEEQKDFLKQTLETANAACNWLSERAWSESTFRTYDLHNIAYHDCRDQFPLSSQMTVRAIGKVADAYRLDHKTKREFKLLGAFPYDHRILSWKTRDKQEVSIWTLEGREHIPFVCGEHQKQMLENRLGQADLIFRDGEFYLHQVCEVETPDPYDPEGWIGVDLGIVNIATSSDGEVFSGEQVEARRQWYEDRRQILQSVGTRSAKRRLKSMSGRQSRFQKHVNHCISKRLVETAQRTGYGIALEDLTGIRSRTRVSRGQRSRHSNWTFRQLRDFVSYKAERAGVPVLFIDPKNTSKACSSCGHCSSDNRPTRDNFMCEVCGHVAPADLNAAANIAAKADVRQPMVAPTLAATSS